jgi:hypothetical protein
LELDREELDCWCLLVDMDTPGVQVGQADQDNLVDLYSLVVQEGRACLDRHGLQVPGEVGQEWKTVQVMHLARVLFYLGLEKLLRWVWLGMEWCWVGEEWF